MCRSRRAEASGNEANPAGFDTTAPLGDGKNRWIKSCSRGSWPKVDTRGHCRPPGVLEHGVEVGRSAVAGVAVPELGPWEPLSLTDIDHDFRRAAVRWWIGADERSSFISAARGANTRTPTSGCPDLFGLRPFLDGWDLYYVAAAGAIEPGAGQELRGELHQNDL
jgi:hypothetical protein